MALPDPGPRAGAPSSISRRTATRGSPRAPNCVHFVTASLERDLARRFDPSVAGSAWARGPSGGGDAVRTSRPIPRSARRRGAVVDFGRDDGARLAAGAQLRALRHRLLGDGVAQLVLYFGRSLHP
jgi:hypothetical protein